MAGKRVAVGMGTVLAVGLSIAVAGVGWAGASVLGATSLLDSPAPATPVSAPAAHPAGVVPPGPGTQTRPLSSSVGSGHRHPSAPSPVLAGHPLSAQTVGTSTGPGRVGQSGSASAAANAVLASLGHLRVPPGWLMTTHVVSVGGMDRAYAVLVPRHLTGRVPVIVLLHGRTMNPASILAVTALSQALGPAVIVAPAGWQASWDAGWCCGVAAAKGVDDVTFIKTALSKVLASTPAADPSRMYAVGFSNGGRMAYRLACDDPGQFRGVMAVEAVPTDTCPSMHPVDVTVVAQQGDPLLSVSAGQPARRVAGRPEPTVPSVIAQLRRLDGCSGQPLVASYGQSNESTWSCAGRHDLRYVWYPGGSHTWRQPAGGTPGATWFAAQLVGNRLSPTPSPTPASVPLVGRQPAPGNHS